MARVDDHRGDDGREVLVEVLREGRSVLRGIGAGLNAGKAMGDKLALDQRKGLLLAGDVCRECRKHVVELLGGRPVRLVVARLVLEGGEVGEAADANHEPLVEVRAKDRAELEPLEERDGLVEGLVEHAAVEAQPAQLAVLGVGEVALAAASLLVLLGRVVGKLGGRLLERVVVRGPLARLWVLRSGSLVVCHGRFLPVRVPARMD